MTLLSNTPVTEEEHNVFSDYLNHMLTCEDSQSFFTTMKNGKLEVTNESVKSIVVEKLYKILSTSIAKMDVDYQDILKSNGDYKRYKHFASTDQCIKDLSEIAAKNARTLSKENIADLNIIFGAHRGLISASPIFKDAFKFNIAPVKQYYLSVVASVIYSIGYITTSMIDYEKRDGRVEYSLIFKNENLLEKGLPKNMLKVLKQFNDDINKGSIKKTVDAMKKMPVKVESFDENGGIPPTYEIATGAIILGVTAGVIALLTLPAIIRYLIYFFMHSKIKLSEYLENQAYFLELSVRSLRKSDRADKEEVIRKEEEWINKLYGFAAKLSGDRYQTEKAVDYQVERENKQIVADSDRELKATNDIAANNNDNFDDSSIIL